MKKKMFSFGCSYTNYHWPTYADYIGTMFENYRNQGISGSGNKRIFNIVCSHLHKFTKNDFVVIQWSGLERNDKILPPTHNRIDTFSNRRIDDGTWFSNGSVFENNGFFSEEYRTNYFSYDEQYEMLISYCKCLKMILDNIGCKYLFIFMSNPLNPLLKKLNGEPLAIYYESELRNRMLESFYKKYNHEHFNREFIRNLNFYKKCLFHLQTEIEQNEEPNYIASDLNEHFIKDYHPKSHTHYKIALKLIKDLDIIGDHPLKEDKLMSLSKEIDNKFTYDNMAKIEYDYTTIQVESHNSIRDL